MRLDRRRLLLLGGACVSACRATPPAPGVSADAFRDAPLDALFEAHSSCLPERAGAGANHYPMAAEALDAMGLPGAIPADWLQGAELYAGEQRVRGAVDERAFGDYARFADWRAHFANSLGRGPWRPVVARWVPRLAPGLSGGAFHGILRTAHAVRALRAQDTPARRGELACGLAYWAARYQELPGTGPPAPDAEPFAQTLQGLDRPRLVDGEDVDFSRVFEPVLEAPLAPPVQLDGTGRNAEHELRDLVRGGASALLEMLVQEHSRMWLLHTVTGPAAAGLLIPEVDARGARALVAYSRQASVALHRVYGAPFRAGEHLRDAPRAWPELKQLAAQSRSVHGVKLIEALARYDAEGDLLCRSVAEQWFEWT